MPSQPKPTFLTIPREVRDLIYEFLTDTDPEYQVCQCPAHNSNWLGLCDVRRIAEITGPDDALCVGVVVQSPPAEERPAPSNIKATLMGVCQQMKSEVEPFEVRFPTLIFCDPQCFNHFMQHHKKSRIVELLHYVEISLSEAAEGSPSDLMKAALEEVETVQQLHFMWLASTNIVRHEWHEDVKRPPLEETRIVLERERPRF